MASRLTSKTLKFGNVQKSDNPLAPAIIQQIIEVMDTKLHWTWSRRKLDPNSLFLIRAGNLWAKNPPHIVIKLVGDKIKIIEVPEGIKLKTITIANPRYLAEFEVFIDNLYESGQSIG